MQATKLFLLVLSLVGVFSAPFGGKTRVLVLYDNQAIHLTHSIFFKQLEDMGYNLDFHLYNSPTLKLISYGEYNYEHLILFSSADDELKGFKTKDVFEFFDSGRNVMILGNADQNKQFRHLFNGFGFDMHELGSFVFDHFNNLQASDPLTVTTRNHVKNTPFIQGVQKPIIYRGSGISVTPYETNQVYSLVRGSETTYSKKEEQDDMIIGSNIVLVGATQGRNNARSILTGGWDIFSNEFLQNQNYDNLELARSIIRWNLGETGVLKSGELVHRRVGSTETFPQNYKVSEEAYFSVELWQWDSQAETWIPFTALENDVLLEFVMLDPYYRVPLKQNEKEKAKYEIEFKIPDKYGIFQFKVNYLRPGYSFVKVAEKVTVRPYRHDEYPRYLLQAYPYYLSTFGTIGGFLVFLVYFLLHKEEKVKDE